MKYSYKQLAQAKLDSPLLSKDELIEVLESRQDRSLEVIELKTLHNLF